MTITAAVVGITVFGSSGAPQIAQRPDYDPSSDDTDTKQPKSSPTPKTSSPPEVTSTTTNDNSQILANDPGNSAQKPNLPSGKKYTEMSDAERRQYIEAKAMRVAQNIGNSSSEQIPPEAVDKIKSFIDGYASRIKVKPRTGSCGFSDNLQSTFERASKNAPFIIKAFNEKGMDPRIGLYLAMIESEHCVCLQSGTGPLGMFQFTY